jgi:transposase
MGGQKKPSKSSGARTELELLHPEGFKARMVARMTGPEGASASALSRETGVTQTTLSRWLRKASSLHRMSQPQEPSNSPREWTPEEKLRVVSEASQLEQKDLGAFLRREGLHEAQLQEWTRAAVASLGAPRPNTRRATDSERRILHLERELERKDKALAEVTALLVLQKKLRALLGDAGDGTDTGSET